MFVDGFHFACISRYKKNKFLLYVTYVLQKVFCSRVCLKHTVNAELGLFGSTSFTSLHYLVYPLLDIRGEKKNNGT